MRSTVAELVLPLKREFFEQIRTGNKTEEFRLLTPFWKKRLEGRSFDRVVLTLGYPKKEDHARRLVLPWKGYCIKEIAHPFFGPDPVMVYAIDVSGRPLVSSVSRGCVELMSR